MKIGVLSDIHLKEDDGRVERIVNQYLSDVDIFFLCGDYTGMSVYEMFLHKEVHAVAGNMDDHEVRSILPIKRIVTIKGRKFGIIHGWGAPLYMENRIAHEFTNVDCIVYGHTHFPNNSMSGDTLFFNPGSPTDKRFAPSNSVGIINVTDDGIIGEIIKL